VIEGLAPIVADVDGDGEVEAVVTASDGADGARVVALGADGSRFPGPAIGKGHRWRHQLAVAPFGPDGEREVASVLTPHIGGEAEFFRAVGGRLERVAATPGYSSHDIGSRNLDAALAGPYAADDRTALVVPETGKHDLAVLVREDDSVTQVGRVAVGDGLTSNVVAAGGGRVVAAGTRAGLRFWSG
jgi:hypothetical protein